MTCLTFSRREFVIGALAGATAGAGITAALLRKSSSVPSGSSGGSVFHTDRAARITTLSYIAVDHARCSGCGICEAECAIVHDHALDTERSRIRVHHFEPALAIASVCSGCGDAPCLSACPKDVVALSRDRLTGAILLDEAKCIGCGACQTACARERSGVIRMRRDGKKACGICDLCGGDPACVKACPERCLSLVPANQDGRDLAVKSAAIAQSLSRHLYRSGRDE